MKKVILLILLLIGSNLFWFCSYIYAGIDSGVTRTYQNDSYQHAADALEQAVIIANSNVIGKDVDYARSVIGIDTSGSEPFIKEGCFYINEFCLKLNQDQIVESVEIADLNLGTYKG